VCELIILTCGEITFSQCWSRSLPVHQGPFQMSKKDDEGKKYGRSKTETQVIVTLS
jgi:hypothetical protein